MCVYVCAYVCVGFSGSLWHSDLTGRHVYDMYKLSRIQAYQHEPCSRYALQYHSCFPILQLAVLCLGLVSAAL